MPRRRPGRHVSAAERALMDLVRTGTHEKAARGLASVCDALAGREPGLRYGASSPLAGSGDNGGEGPHAAPVWEAGRGPVIAITAGRRRTRAAYTAMSAAGGG